MPTADAFAEASSHATCSVGHLMDFNSLDSLSTPLALQIGKLRRSEVQSFTCWPGPFLPPGMVFS